MSSNFLGSIFDYILWYGKDKSKTKFRSLYVERTKESSDSGFPYIELDDGTRFSFEIMRLTNREGQHFIRQR